MKPKINRRKFNNTALCKNNKNRFDVLCGVASYHNGCEASPFWMHWQISAIQTRITRPTIMELIAMRLLWNCSQKPAESAHSTLLCDMNDGLLQKILTVRDINWTVWQHLSILQAPQLQIFMYMHFNSTWLYVHVLFLVTVQCTLIESITYMYKRDVKFTTNPYHDNVGNTMEKFWEGYGAVATLKINLFMFSCPYGRFENQRNKVEDSSMMRLSFLVKLLCDWFWIHEFYLHHVAAFFCWSYG